jgi:DNA-binding CsgD family transcriptional regulator
MKEMPPFRWEDIDHRLVTLKLLELAEQMRVQIKEAKAQIQLDNRGNSNGSAVLSLILKMNQERTEEWARRKYEIYCQVWRTRGHIKSAAFIRAVAARAVLDTFRSRTPAIAAEFSKSALRTNVPFTMRDAMLNRFRLDMQRMEDRWRRRLEIEAKECEDAERTKNLGNIAASWSQAQDQPGLQNLSEYGTVVARTTVGTAVRRTARKKKVDLGRYLHTANLTEKQYECSSLRWEYGLSISDIAKELGRSRKAVDQHIHAAQAKMRLSGQYENVKKKLSQLRPAE